MSAIVVTGSTEGIGRATAAAILDQGRDVIVHARNRERRRALASLVDRGARAVVGDLGDLHQLREMADELSRLGDVDAVIHNAGVMSGPALLTVNLLAPYVLTALMPSPSRLIYLSSSMHRSGNPDLDHIEWTSQPHGASYSDSKLLLTALSAAVARRRLHVAVNAVDPGWVPTRMGGTSATDDLALGHVTQTWLATSDDQAALVSGGYWFHQRRQRPESITEKTSFQDALLERLSNVTGIELH